MGLKGKTVTEHERLVGLALPQAALLLEGGLTHTLSQHKAAHVLFVCSYADYDPFSREKKCIYESS